jgi:hypothetical protein
VIISQCLLEFLAQIIIGGFACLLLHLSLKVLSQLAHFSFISFLNGIYVKHEPLLLLTSSIIVFEFGLDQLAILVHDPLKALQLSGHEAQSLLNEIEFLEVIMHQ